MSMDRVTFSIPASGTAFPPDITSDVALRWFAHFVSQLLGLSQVSQAGGPDKNVYTFTNQTGDYATIEILRPTMTCVLTDVHGLSEEIVTKHIVMALERACNGYCTDDDVVYRVGIRTEDLHPQ